MLGGEKKYKESVFGRQNNNSLKKEGRKKGKQEKRGKENIKN